MKTREPTFFYGYVVVIAAFLIMMVMYGTMYTFGVFFEPLLVEFDWTRAITSGAFSMYFILFGLLGILAGRLNDRFGPRMVVVACGFFLGSGYLLMSQISTIWQLYLFYGVIIATGASGGFVPLASTVARWFVKRRGLMTGIVISGTGLGTVVMPPIAARLISSYGWRASYVIVGIMALVLVILAAQFLRRDPSQVGQLPYGEGKPKQENLNLEAKGFSLRRAIHTRQFWMLCGMFSSFNFLLQAIMVHIVIHATGLGISVASAANILAIIGGLSIAGRIIMGSAGDRIGNKAALIICFSLMSIALLWLQLAKEVWMLYLFAAIFGFAYGGKSTLLSPMVAELFGLSSLGVILGVIEFTLAIGGAIGPALAGHIFDITGSYQLAFLVCVAASIVGLILALLFRPTTREEALDSIKASV